MTSIEKVYIPQRAILWRFVRFDNYGQPTVSDAEEIDGEWPQGLSESNANQDSKETSSNEVVVNESIPIHSVLWFGEYNDLPTGTAEDPSPLYTVVGRNEQPDIKGRATRYTLTVSRLSSTLPVIV